MRCIEEYRQSMYSQQYLEATIPGSTYVLSWGLVFLGSYVSRVQYISGSMFPNAPYGLSQVHLSAGSHVPWFYVQYRIIHSRVSSQQSNLGFWEQTYSELGNIGR